jgi:hypothetical protein
MPYLAASLRPIILKGKINMTNGRFYFPSTNVKLNAEAFGYWSVRWSDDLAEHYQTTLCKGDLDGCATYMSCYLTRLQLLALFSAAHIAYAVYILKMPSEWNEDIKIGVRKCVQEFRTFDGDIISSGLAEGFHSFFYHSLEAIIKDLFDDAAENVFNPDINNVTKDFINTIEHYHFNDGKMTQLEKTYIGSLVCRIPCTIFESLDSMGVIITI